jgi:glycine/D-amino acid oxidase-like deaminating enzyme/nitrite reductase/ring-hydroxylating ferredoxin subunit
MAPLTQIATRSYWNETALPRFPKLDRDLDVDVVVIGGGITGITAAYLLKQAGRRVALIERDRCARVDTAHTTAHLTCVVDTRLSDLVKSFGENHAQAVWDAGLAAMSQIDEIVRSEHIDCGFAWVPGYLHAPALGDVDAATVRSLRNEADVAVDLGFDARYVDRVPHINRPGVEFPNQARFHPRKYLAALANRINGHGSFVFEHTDAEAVQDDPRTVTAAGHRMTCEHLVIATHTPIMGVTGLVPATLLQTKLALYTSYAIGGRVGRGALPDALFWDTGDPYYYLRLDPHRDYDEIIFGGEDHKTGQSDDTQACFERLENALRRLVPGVQVTHHWSGQVIETPDGLPYIGETAARQHAATGFSGNGMTFGTLGAMMAADAIAGRDNPWRELFDPSRKKIRGGLWDYIKENKDYPYYLIRDRFAGPEGRALRDVPRGEGRILALNGRTVAAYRDADGSVTLRSAVCTHMACHVNWNPAERTWDCPCHGSRFTPDGKVISGPAESPLEKIEQT